MARSVFYYHLSRLNDGDGYDDTRKRLKAIYDENKDVTDTEESVWHYATKVTISTIRLYKN